MNSRCCSCWEFRDQADVTSRQDLFLILRADALDQGLSALRRNDMIELRHHVQQRYLDVLQVDRLATDLQRDLIEPRVCRIEYRDKVQTGRG